MTQQQRHRVELPTIVEDAFQNSRHRTKASREDFYAGFIAALDAPQINWKAARDLINEYYDQEIYEEDE